MKITWYILVLLVFMFLIILTIRKILEGHRRVQKWQSKYNPCSAKELLISSLDLISFLVQFSISCAPTVYKWRF